MSQFVGEEFVANARRHRYRRRRVRIKSIQNASSALKKNRLLLSPRCCTKKKSTRVPFFTTFNAFLVNFPSANGEAIAHTGLSLVSSSSSPGVDGTGNPSRPRFFDEPPPPPLSAGCLSPRFSFFAFFALFPPPLDPIPSRCSYCTR